MAASTSSEDNAAAAVPWLDLPEGLTEEILGRLLVHDYVRFGAVCRRWGSIQRDHRLRHPPVKIPWFVPYWPREKSVVCPVGLHPVEERRLQIPFSPTYIASLESEEEEAKFPVYSSLPHGWLLFDDWPRCIPRSYRFTLLNPITGAQIPLPTLGDPLPTLGDQQFEYYKATISPPPLSVVFVLTAYDRSNELHLYRQGDPRWTDLWDSCDCDWWDRCDCDYLPMDLASVICYDSKFYSFRLGMDFMAFDVHCPPHIEPHFLEMDQSLLPTDYQHRPTVYQHSLKVFLVESNGRMLLVCKYFDHFDPQLVRFELFEADLSNMRWAKAECLGDQALIIYGKFAVSLTAADVGVRRNCIYIREWLRNERVPAPWNMFDLSTCKLADASLPFPPSPSRHLMSVPSIY